MTEKRKSDEKLVRKNKNLRKGLTELISSFSPPKIKPKIQLFQIALVLEEAQEAITVVQDLQHKYVNKRVTEITGYTHEELRDKPIRETIHPRDLRKVIIQNKKRMEGQVVKYNYRLIDKNGDIKWLESVGTKILWEGRPAALCFVTDLTDRLKAEKELKKKTQNLEEVNTALHVLLKVREKDIDEVEDRVLRNVRELILPYIDKLRSLTSHSDSPFTKYIDLLEKNITEIVSPFLRIISQQYANLTPREIQIAALVKEGKTSKEISEILHIAIETVNKNRKNIRKKFHLKDKTDNLRVRLLSLQN